MRKLFIVVITLGLLFVATGCSKDTVEVNGKSYKVTEVDGMKAIDNEIFISTGEYLDINLTLVVSGTEATVIDTGDSPDEMNRVRNYITDNDLTLKNIIITHNHGDHDRYVSMFPQDGVTVYRFADTTDNQEITMGDMTFKILHTPGHSDDEHMSVLINGEVLVAGDVIVSPETISPVTMLNYGGDKDTLLATLATLNETNYSFIIPGHGELSTGNDIIQDNIDALNAEDDSE